MNRNSRYDNQRALIEDDSINISEPHDGRAFLKIMLIIAVIVLSIFFSCDLISSVIIDNMSNETQMKIEKSISSGGLKFKLLEDKKYKIKTAQLTRMKNRMVKLDRNLQGKSDFKISIIDDKNVNACIAPDGSIYFTKALIDENFTEQELAFVLAHELGHYAHRDHLKSIGRELMLYMIFYVFGRDEAGSAVNGISNAASLSHSRKQEKNADLFAGEMLQKIYGTKQGGISFITKIKEKEKYPEFLFYLSTHPSWNDRLNQLNQP